MVGVDHIIYKGKPYLLEINGSPGTTLIMKAINIKIITLFQNHLIE